MFALRPRPSVSHRRAHGAAGVAHQLSPPDLVLYCEAFLTTYRTFISPEELIKKLQYRYPFLAPPTLGPPTLEKEGPSRRRPSFRGLVAEGAAGAGAAGFCRALALGPHTRLPWELPPHQ